MNLDLGKKGEAMPLHNDKPNADRLDTLARKVLSQAIVFERAKAEGAARNSYGEGCQAESEALCEAVKIYREAMVAELIGSEQPQGSTV